MKVTCPECDGTAHRLGESDARDKDGNLLAARYVCHGEMNLRDIGDGDKTSNDGYPKGEFYVDFRNNNTDEIKYISQEKFGRIRRKHKNN